MRVLSFALLVLLTSSAIADEKEKLFSTNIELRTILAFKVSDVAVKKMLPADWEINSPISGPSKGSNLGISLIDQVLVQDPDGKSVSTSRGMSLTIPAKKKGADAAGTMVFVGFWSPNGVPGAYDVYLPAAVVIDRQEHTDVSGKTNIEETWNFKTADANSTEIRIQFDRGVSTRGKLEAKVYSARKPDVYRIYRIEQSADVVRSTAIGVDRVARFSFKTTDPRLGSLFDGSEQLISVTSIPWYSRSVYLPGQ
jgi:hypothetical protein